MCHTVECEQKGEHGLVMASCDHVGLRSSCCCCTVLHAAMPEPLALKRLPHIDTSPLLWNNEEPEVSRVLSASQAGL